MLPDIIETARLRLRPFRLRDVDDVLVYATGSRGASHRSVRSRICGRLCERKESDHDVDNDRDGVHRDVRSREPESGVGVL